MGARPREAVRAAARFRRRPLDRDGQHIGSAALPAAWSPIRHDPLRPRGRVDGNVPGPVDEALRDARAARDVREAGGQQAAPPRLPTGPHCGRGQSGSGAVHARRRCARAPRPHGDGAESTQERLIEARQRVDLRRKGHPASCGQHARRGPCPRAQHRGLHFDRNLQALQIQGRRPGRRVEGHLARRERRRLDLKRARSPPLAPRPPPPALSSP